MIVRLTEEREKEYRAILRGERCTGARIAASMDCYGLSDDVCCFYLVDSSGALMVQGAQALLCGNAADVGELEHFLEFSGVRSFFAERVMLERWRAAPRLLLGHAGPARRPDAEFPGLDRRPDLWALSQSGLLDVEQPVYYADACRRVNAGSAVIWAVKDSAGGYRSTAGLYALTGGAAYLTAVATRPEDRGQGCAGALVQGLCAFAAPRPVYLICAPGLRGFYEKLGFRLVTPICEFLPPEGR